jgi:hypothetical protein
MVGEKLGKYTILEILGRALSKRREERYQSIRELLEQVRRIRDGAFVPGSRAEAPAGFLKRHSSRFLRTASS